VKTQQDNGSSFIPTRGIVYVANTSTYIDEALRSYASLRRVMPDTPVTVISHPNLFRDVIGINWSELGKNDYDTPIIKVEAWGSPYKQSLLLDTDTRVIGDLTPVFDVLDQFDVAAAHEPTRGWDYPTRAAKAFCELNTGVLAFKKSEQTEHFFSLWREIYEAKRAELGLLNDQPAFREALWLSQNIRLATLPTEFHLITGKAAGIAWEARLLHGRDRLDKVERIVNTRLGPRAYLPGHGIVTGFSGRRSVIDNWIRFSKYALRNFFSVFSKENPAPGDWQERATHGKK
jgi:hypothetical protein